MADLLCSTESPSADQSQIGQVVLFLVLVPRNPSCFQPYSLEFGLCCEFHDHCQWLFCGHWTIRERAVTFASCEIWSPDDRRRGREFLHGTERDQCQWRPQGLKRRVYSVGLFFLLECQWRVFLGELHREPKGTAKFALLLPDPAEATNLPPRCPRRLLYPLSTLGSTRSVPQWLRLLSLLFT